ncbi:hypothetical protein ROSINTL182_07911 [Roseburia intestinalis L1-82]|uniref:Uncharacterized protein n=1 Tax=Roseburia intestinalis L1-82 TaxID=536231 RepID=C7GDB0_9FIRM|nr:hypothetical protein ROSINTL182_07911 [Roseburia intestinalis L1-82]
MLRNPGVEIKQILAPVFLPENKKLQVTMKFFTKIGRKTRKPYTLGYTQ